MVPAEDQFVPCPRCGKAIPKTRSRCATCENNLGVASDQHLGSNGLPTLARMSVKNGTLAGYSYLFPQGITTIGRTQGNDFILPGRTVSRRHARLWFSAGYWYLEDLQSANGTVVNQIRIYQPIVLNDKDVIYFGDEIVIFTIDSHDPAPGKLELR